MALADIRTTRASIRRLEQVKTWQLIVLFVMGSFISATFLRLNNIGMIERRDAVVAADTSGEDDALAQRLYDLQRFVAAHMNTDPGKIALTNTYQRDNQKLKEENERISDSNPNGNVYRQAAQVCDPIARAQGWRWPDPRYTECVSNELAKYPSAGQLKDAYRPIPAEPYYHTFRAPVWSADFAGWSLLVTGVIGLLIISRLLALLVLRILLGRLYRQV